MNIFSAPQSLLEKLTQTVYLDRLLKVAGVAGFVLTYLNAWRSMRPAKRQSPTPAISH